MDWYWKWKSIHCHSNHFILLMKMAINLSRNAASCLAEKNKYMYIIINCVYCRMPEVAQMIITSVKTIEAYCDFDLSHMACLERLFWIKNFLFFLQNFQFSWRKKKWENALDQIFDTLFKIVSRILCTNTKKGSFKKWGRLLQPHVTNFILLWSSSWSSYMNSHSYFL